MDRAMSRLPAHLTIWLLGAGPLGWAWWSAPRPDLVDPAAVLAATGSAAGIAGLSWLLLALLLSHRLPGFDVPFGGLIRLWRIHHIIGAASFIMLLLHPVFLSLAAVPGGPEVVLAVLTPPPTHWPIWAGWLALLLMMMFMAPSFSFFGTPDYPRWKLLHRLSAAAAVLGIAHAIPLSRALPAAQAAWLWGAFGALAGGAFLWRTMLSRWLSRTPYVIADVRHPAAGVVELTLEGPALDFRAGQFVYLTPLDPTLPAGRGEEHPYAIVSAPHEDRLRIAIKDLGDASHALLDVSPGSRVLVEGPYGHFLPERHDRPSLWIGGGIGLTPFVSAARAFAGSPVDVQLVYCANDASRAYFLAELETIARRTPGLVVHAHYFAEQGPLSHRYLSARVPDVAARAAYVCGPQALLDLAKALLRRSGVPRRRIATEEFNLL